MRPSTLGALILLRTAIVLAESTESSEMVAAPEGRTVDSYLEAWKHSRTSTDPREGVVAVDGPVSTLHRRKDRPVTAAKRSEIATDRDSFSMVPSDSYTLPNRARIPASYGPPRETYGVSGSDEYKPYGNAGFYSPPAGQGYGPPAVPASYGSSSVPYGHATSESLHLGIPTIDFTWPFALKLNAFTVAKILLKLVIFKMIVKFIAVICLLLFIPKLEIKKGNKGSGGGGNDDDDDEDEGRRWMNAESIAWDRLNVLTLAVRNALERYDGENIEPRRSTADATERRVRRILGNDRAWPDYEQLLRSYVLEEARRIRERS